MASQGQCPEEVLEELILLKSLVMNSGCNKFFYLQALPFISIFVCYF